MRFATGQRETPLKIHEALVSGDRQLAERLAHTVKGIAGNIGAAELQVAAGNLEHAIDIGVPDAEINEMLAILESVVSETIQRIDIGLKAEMPDSTVNQKQPTENSRSLSEILETLTQYAHESDSEALDYVGVVLADLYAMCEKEQVEILVAALRNFDFEAALTTLKILSERLPN